MRANLGVIALVISGIVCLSSCSNGFVKNFAETGKLQQQLRDKYPEKEINVSQRYSGYLVISFVDSPLNHQDGAKRAARAEDVARFVVKNFPSIGKIHSISILFMESNRRWAVFRSTRSLSYFSFNNRGEPFRPTDITNIASENEDPLSPNVRFNPARNETDISLTKIQLEGDLNHGLAMVPFFTTKGDARPSAQAAVAPRLVGLDFASYADQKLFSSNAKLEVMCDGNHGVPTIAVLLSPKDSGSEGSNAQFLTAQIPFDEFVRMGEARKVRVRLNNREYELGADEIAALKRMADFVVQPGGTNR